MTAFIPPMKFYQRQVTKTTDYTRYTKIVLGLSYLYTYVFHQKFKYLSFLSQSPKLSPWDKINSV